MATQLLLPDHGLRLRVTSSGEEVFDPCRKLWVALTPEENVRQHFLNYLILDRQCPAGLVRTEQEIKLNGMSKRADIVVHDDHGLALALVECKAPDVRIDQSVFDQAVRYNLVFKVRWLMLTNGIKHYCYLLDPATGEVKNQSLIPAWADLMAAQGPV